MCLFNKSFLHCQCDWHSSLGKPRRRYNLSRNKTDTPTIQLSRICFLSLQQFLFVVIKNSGVHNHEFRNSFVIGHSRHQPFDVPYYSWQPRVVMVLISKEMPLDDVTSYSIDGLTSPIHIVNYFSRYTCTTWGPWHTLYLRELRHAESSCYTRIKHVLHHSCCRYK